MNILRSLAGALALATLTVMLNGCSYDYLQHTDRVAYNAGDAVKANLESETINPSKRSMYYTKGLGKNGIASVTAVTPSAPGTAAPAASPPAAPPAIN